MRLLNSVLFTLLKPMPQTPSPAKLPRISGLSLKRSCSPPSWLRSPCFQPSHIPALSLLLYLPSSWVGLRCPAHPLVAVPVDSSYTFPSIVCDHQVRWGHVDKQLWLSRVEAGVLLGA